MELKIDTKLDSSDDLKKVIKFLQEFIDKSEASSQEKSTPQKLKIDTNINKPELKIKPSKNEETENIDEKLEEVGIMVY